MVVEQVVTFDFYGTLVRWHEGLEAAFGEILAHRGLPATQTTQLIHDFHTEGRRLRDTPPWRPYREVLRDSLEFAMRTAGLHVQTADFDRLLGRVSSLSAHPDVPAALTHLRHNGYRLAAISNTDDELIVGSLPNLGLELDAVITAEQARAYKPNPQLFRHAHQQLGVRTEHVIHIAASQPLDMAVCHSMGIRAFWVNRRNEQPLIEYMPFTEVKDVGEAAQLL
ncbi:haloacid dehalogenase type II [Nocardia sp. NPDC050710]|uniref:haloacid dehalogenase type II n=1 Tax=Nocardia sp. NPDC050710 TaxID=3157220 RepID=UPI0033E03B71